MTQRRTKLLLKITALGLVAAFFCQEIGWAMPETAHAFAMPKSALDQVLLDPSRIEIPSEFATLKEVHSQGSSAPLLIHIQDAHSNVSGQENLAKTLDALMSRYGVSLVLSEGGAGDCSLTSFKKIASQDTWDRVAKSFLMQGKIAGEEYLNLTSNRPMKIMGIEDMPLYMQSVEQYASLADKREEIIRYLKTTRRVVEKLKLKMYPAELIQYEKLRTGEKKTDINFEKASGKLSELCASKNIPLAEYPELEKLAALRQKESLINFNLANLEQAALIEEIAKNGGKEDLDAHLAKMEQMKNARVQQFAYFQNTLNIAKDKGVATELYTNYLAYVDYLKDFTALDLDELITEFEKAEDRLYAAMLGSDDARLVRSIDRYLGLLVTAYSIQMTTKEFDLFKANEPDFATAAYLAFLNRKLAEQGYFEDFIPYEDFLEKGKESLDAFYHSVNERDLVFMRNVENTLNGESQKIAVLITGGYHTPHLKELLKAKGYSYAVVTPVVTSETNQSKYEKILLSPVRKSIKTIETSNGSVKKSPRSSDLRARLVEMDPNGLLEELRIAANPNAQPVRNTTAEPQFALAGSRMAGAQAGLSRRQFLQSAGLVAAGLTTQNLLAQDQENSIENLKKAYPRINFDDLDSLARTDSPLAKRLALEIIRGFGALKRINQNYLESGVFDPKTGQRKYEIKIDKLAQTLSFKFNESGRDHNLVPLGEIQDKVWRHIFIDNFNRSQLPDEAYFLWYELVGEDEMKMNLEKIRSRMRQGRLEGAPNENTVLSIEREMRSSREFNIYLEAYLGFADTKSLNPAGLKYMELLVTRGKVTARELDEALSFWQKYRTEIKMLGVALGALSVGASYWFWRHLKINKERVFPPQTPPPSRTSESGPGSRLAKKQEALSAESRRIVESRGRDASTFLNRPLTAAEIEINSSPFPANGKFEGSRKAGRYVISFPSYAANKLRRVSVAGVKDGSIVLPAPPATGSNQNIFINSEGRQLSCKEILTDSGAWLFIEILGEPGFDLLPAVYDGPFARQTLFERSTIGRKFLDSLLGITAESGSERAQQIVHGLRREAATDPRLRSAPAPGNRSVSLFSDTKRINIPMGQALDRLYGMLVDRELNGRFLVFEDVFNPNNFVVYEMTVDQDGILHAEYRGQEDRVVVDISDKSQKWISASSLPEMRKFFRGISRGLEVIEPREDNKYYDFTLAQDLSIYLSNANDDVFAVKAYRQTVPTKTGLRIHAQSGQRTQEEEPAVYPIYFLKRDLRPRQGALTAPELIRLPGFEDPPNYVLQNIDGENRLLQRVPDVAGAPETVSYAPISQDDIFLRMDLSADGLSFTIDGVTFQGRPVEFRGVHRFSLKNFTLQCRDSRYISFPDRWKTQYQNEPVAPTGIDRVVFKVSFRGQTLVLTEDRRPVKSLEDFETLGRELDATIDLELAVATNQGSRLATKAPAPDQTPSGWLPPQSAADSSSPLARGARLALPTFSGMLEGRQEFKTLVSGKQRVLKLSDASKADLLNAFYEFLSLRLKRGIDLVRIVPPNGWLPGYGFELSQPMSGDKSKVSVWAKTGQRDSRLDLPLFNEAGQKNVLSLIQVILDIERYQRSAEYPSIGRYAERIAQGIFLGSAPATVFMQMAILKGITLSPEVLLATVAGAVTTAFVYITWPTVYNRLRASHVLNNYEPWLHDHSPQSQGSRLAVSTGEKTDIKPAQAPVAERAPPSSLSGLIDDATSAYQTFEEFQSLYETKPQELPGILDSLSAKLGELSRKLELEKRHYEKIGQMMRASVSASLEMVEDAYIKHGRGAMALVSLDFTELNEIAKPEQYDLPGFGDAVRQILISNLSREKFRIEEVTLDEAEYAVSYHGTNVLITNLPAGETGTADIRTAFTRAVKKTLEEVSLYPYVPNEKAGILKAPYSSRKDFVDSLERLHPGKGEQLAGAFEERVKKLSFHFAHTLLPRADVPQENPLVNWKKDQGLTDLVEGRFTQNAWMALRKMKVKEAEEDFVYFTPKGLENIGSWPVEERYRYFKQYDIFLLKRRAVLAEAAAWLRKEWREARDPVTLNEEKETWARTQLIDLIEYIIYDAYQKLDERKEEIVGAKRLAATSAEHRRLLDLLESNISTGETGVYFYDDERARTKIKNEVEKDKALAALHYSLLQSARRNTRPLQAYHTGKLPRPLHYFNGAMQAIRKTDEALASLYGTINALKEKNGQLDPREIPQLYSSLLQFSDDYRLSHRRWLEASVLAYRDMRLPEVVQYRFAGEYLQADANGRVEKLHKHFQSLALEGNITETTHTRVMRFVGLTRPGHVVIKKPVGDEVFISVKLPDGRHMTIEIEFNNASDFMNIHQPDLKDTLIHKILLRFVNIADDAYRSNADSDKAGVIANQLIEAIHAAVKKAGLRDVPKTKKVSLLMPDTKDKREAPVERMPVYTLEDRRGIYAMASNGLVMFRADPTQPFTQARGVSGKDLKSSVSHPIMTTLSGTGVYADPVDYASVENPNEVFRNLAEKLDASTGAAKSLVEISEFNKRVKRVYHIKETERRAGARLAESAVIQSKPERPTLSSIPHQIAKKTKWFVSHPTLTDKDVSDAVWSFDEEYLPKDVQGRFVPFSNQDMIEVLSAVNKTMNEEEFGGEIEGNTALSKYEYSPNEEFRKLLNGDGAPLWSWRVGPLDRLIRDLPAFFDAAAIKSNEEPVFLARDAVTGGEFLRYLGVIQGAPKKFAAVYQPGMLPSAIVSDYIDDASIRRVQEATARARERAKALAIQEYNHNTGDHVPSKRSNPFYNVFHPILYESIARHFSDSMQEEWSKNPELYRDAKILYEQFKKVHELSKKQIVLMDLAATGRTLLYVKSVIEYFSKLENDPITVRVFVGWSHDPKLFLPETRLLNPSFHNNGKPFRDQEWAFRRLKRDEATGETIFEFNPRSRRSHILIQVYRSMRLYNEALNYAASSSAMASGSRLASKNTEGKMTGAPVIGRLAFYSPSLPEEIIFMVEPKDVPAVLEHFNKVISDVVTRLKWEKGDNDEYAKFLDVRAKAISSLMEGMVDMPSQRITNPMSILVTEIRNRIVALENAHDKEISAERQFDDLTRWRGIQDYLRSTLIMDSYLIGKSYENNDEPTPQETWRAHMLAQQELSKIGQIVERFIQSAQRELRGIKSQLKENEAQTADLLKAKQTLEQEKAVADVDLKPHFDIEIDDVDKALGKLEAARKLLEKSGEALENFSIKLPRQIKDVYLGEHLEDTRRQMVNENKGFSRILYENHLTGNNALYAQRRKLVNDIAAKRQANAADPSLAAYELMLGRLNDSIQFYADFVAKFLDVESHQIRLVDDKESNIILVVTDPMTPNTLNDIANLYGPRLKFFVTDAATPITHWVSVAGAFRQRPGIMFLDDKKFLASVKESDLLGAEAVVYPQPESEVGRFVINPRKEDMDRFQAASKAQAEASDRERTAVEAYFGSGQKMEVGFKVNTSLENPEKISEAYVSGFGLVRTEILKRRAREILNQLAEASPTFWPGLLKNLSGEMVYSYKDILLASGNSVVSFRTFDFQPDKNGEFIDLLVERHLNYPEARILGNVKTEADAREVCASFDFYKTPIGKAIAERQLVDFFTTLSEQPNVPMMRVMFPNIRNAADVEYIQKILIPEAKKTFFYENKHGRKISEINNIFARVQFGLMVETESFIQNMESIFQHRFMKHVHFLSVGTNDLTADVLTTQLMEQLGSKKINRDNPAFSHFFAALNQRVMTHLNLLAARIKKFNEDNTDHSPIELGFCGEIAGTRKFALYADFLRRENGIPIYLSMSFGSLVGSLVTLIKRNGDSHLSAPLDEAFRNPNPTTDVKAIEAVKVLTGSKEVKEVSTKKSPDQEKPKYQKTPEGYYVVQCPNSFHLPQEVTVIQKINPLLAQHGIVLKLRNVTEDAGPKELKAMMDVYGLIAIQGSHMEVILENSGSLSEEKLEQVKDIIGEFVSRNDSEEVSAREETVARLTSFFASGARLAAAGTGTASNDYASQSVESAIRRMKELLALSLPKDLQKRFPQIRHHLNLMNDLLDGKSGAASSAVLMKRIVSDMKYLKKLQQEDGELAMPLREVLDSFKPVLEVSAVQFLNDPANGKNFEDRMTAYLKQLTTLLNSTANQWQAGKDADWRIKHNLLFGHVVGPLNWIADDPALRVAAFRRVRRELRRVAKYPFFQTDAEARQAFPMIYILMKPLARYSRLKPSRTPNLFEVKRISNVVNKLEKVISTVETWKRHIKRHELPENLLKTLTKVRDAANGLKQAQRWRIDFGAEAAGILRSGLLDKLAGELSSLALSIGSSEIDRSASDVKDAMIPDIRFNLNLLAGSRLALNSGWRTHGQKLADERGIYWALDELKEEWLAHKKVEKGVMTDERYMDELLMLLNSNVWYPGVGEYPDASSIVSQIMALEREPDHDANRVSRSAQEDQKILSILREAENRPVAVTILDRIKEIEEKGSVKQFQIYHPILADQNYGLSLKGRASYPQNHWPTFSEEPGDHFSLKTIEQAFNELKNNIRYMVPMNAVYAYRIDDGKRTRFVFIYGNGNTTEASGLDESIQGKVYDWVNPQTKKRIGRNTTHGFYNFVRKQVIDKLWGTVEIAYNGTVSKYIHSLIFALEPHIEYDYYVPQTKGVKVVFSLRNKTSARRQKEKAVLKMPVPAQAEHLATHWAQKYGLSASQASYLDRGDFRIAIARKGDNFAVSVAHKSATTIRDFELARADDIELYEMPATDVLVVKTYLKGRPRESLALDYDEKNGYSWTHIPLAGSRLAKQNVLRTLFLSLAVLIPAGGIYWWMSRENNNRPVATQAAVPDISYSKPAIGIFGRHLDRSDAEKFLNHFEKVVNDARKNHQKLTVVYESEIYGYRSIQALSGNAFAGISEEELFGANADARKVKQYKETIKAVYEKQFDLIRREGLAGMKKSHNEFNNVMLEGILDPKNQDVIEKALIEPQVYSMEELANLLYESNRANYLVTQSMSLSVQKGEYERALQKWKEAETAIMASVHARNAVVARYLKKLKAEAGPNQRVVVLMGAFHADGPEWKDAFGEEWGSFVSADPYVDRSFKGNTAKEFLNERLSTYVHFAPTSVRPRLMQIYFDLVSSLNDKDTETILKEGIPAVHFVYTSPTANPAIRRWNVPPHSAFYMWVRGNVHGPAVEKFSREMESLMGSLMKRSGSRLAEKTETSPELLAAADKLLPRGLFGWSGESRKVILEELVFASTYGLGPFVSTEARKKYLAEHAPYIIPAGFLSRVATLFKFSAVVALAATRYRTGADGKLGYFVRAFWYPTTLLYYFIGILFNSAGTHGFMMRDINKLINADFQIKLPNYTFIASDRTPSELRFIAAHEFAHTVGVGAGAEAFSILRMRQVDDSFYKMGQEQKAFKIKAGAIFALFVVLNLLNMQFGPALLTSAGLTRNSMWISGYGISILLSILMLPIIIRVFKLVTYKHDSYAFDQTVRRVRTWSKDMSKPIAPFLIHYETWKKIAPKEEAEVSNADEVHAELAAAIYGAGRNWEERFEIARLFLNIGMENATYKIYGAYNPLFSGVTFEESVRNVVRHFDKKPFSVKNTLTLDAANPEIKNVPYSGPFWIRAEALVYAISASDAGVEMALESPDLRGTAGKTKKTYAWDSAGEVNISIGSEKASAFTLPNGNLEPKHFRVTLKKDDTGITFSVAHLAPVNETKVLSNGNLSSGSRLARSLIEIGDTLSAVLLALRRDPRADADQRRALVTSALDDLKRRRADLERKIDDGFEKNRDTSAFSEEIGKVKNLMEEAQYLLDALPPAVSSTGSRLAEKSEVQSAAQAIRNLYRHNEFLELKISQLSEFIKKYFVFDKKTGQMVPMMSSQGQGRQMQDWTSLLTILRQYSVAVDQYEEVLRLALSLSYDPMPAQDAVQRGREFEGLNQYIFAWVQYQLAYRYGDGQAREDAKRVRELWLAELKQKGLRGELSDAPIRQGKWLHVDNRTQGFAYSLIYSGRFHILLSFDHNGRLSYYIFGSSEMGVVPYAQNYVDGIIVTKNKKGPWYFRRKEIILTLMCQGRKFQEIEYGQGAESIKWLTDEAYSWRIAHELPLTEEELKLVTLVIKKIYEEKLMPNILGIINESIRQQAAYLRDKRHETAHEMLDLALEDALKVLPGVLFSQFSAYLDPRLAKILEEISRRLTLRSGQATLQGSRLAYAIPAKIPGQPAVPQYFDVNGYYFILSVGKHEIAITQRMGYKTMKVSYTARPSLSVTVPQNKSVDVGEGVSVKLVSRPTGNGKNSWQFEVTNENEASDVYLDRHSSIPAKSTGREDFRALKQQWAEARKRIDPLIAIASNNEMTWCTPEELEKQSQELRDFKAKWGKEEIYSQVNAAAADEIYDLVGLATVDLLLFKGELDKRRLAFLKEPQAVTLIDALVKYAFKSASPEEAVKLLDDTTGKKAIDPLMARQFRSLMAHLERDKVFNTFMRKYKELRANPINYEAVFEALKRPIVTVTVRELSRRVAIGDEFRRRDDDPKYKDKAFKVRRIGNGEVGYQYFDEKAGKYTGDPKKLSIAAFKAIEKDRISHKKLPVEGSRLAVNGQVKLSDQQLIAETERIRKLILRAQKRAGLREKLLAALEQRAPGREKNIKRLSVLKKYPPEHDILLAEDLRLGLLNNLGAFAEPVLSVLNGSDPFLFKHAKGMGLEARPLNISWGGLKTYYPLSDDVMFNTHRNYLGTVQARFESSADVLKALAQTDRNYNSAWPTADKQIPIAHPRGFYFKDTEAWFIGYAMDELQRSDMLLNSDVERRQKASEEFEKAMRSFVDQVVPDNGVVVVVESPDRTFGVPRSTGRILEEAGFRDILPELLPPQAYKNLKDVAQIRFSPWVHDKALTRVGGDVKVYMKRQNGSRLASRRGVSAYYDIKPVKNLDELIKKLRDMRAAGAIDSRFLFEEDRPTAVRVIFGNYAQSFHIWRDADSLADFLNKPELPNPPAAPSTFITHTKYVNGVKFIAPDSSDFFIHSLKADKEQSDFEARQVAMGSKAMSLLERRDQELGNAVQNLNAWAQKGTFEGGVSFTKIEPSDAKTVLVLKDKSVVAQFSIEDDAAAISATLNRYIKPTGARLATGTSEYLYHGTYFGLVMHAFFENEGYFGGINTALTPDKSYAGTFGRAGSRNVSELAYDTESAMESVEPQYRPFVNHILLELQNQKNESNGQAAVLPANAIRIVKADGPISLSDLSLESKKELIKRLRKLSQDRRLDSAAFAGLKEKLELREPLPWMTASWDKWKEAWTEQGGPAQKFAGVYGSRLVSEQVKDISSVGPETISWLTKALKQNPRIADGKYYSFLNSGLDKSKDSVVLVRFGAAQLEFFTRDIQSNEIISLGEPIAITPEIAAQAQALPVSGRIHVNETSSEILATSPQALEAQAQNKRTTRFARQMYSAGKFSPEKNILLPFITGRELTSEEIAFYLREKETLQSITGRNVRLQFLKKTDSGFEVYGPSDEITDWQRSQYDVVYMGENTAENLALANQNTHPKTGNQSGFVVLPALEKGQIIDFVADAVLGVMIGRSDAGTSIVNLEPLTQLWNQLKADPDPTAKLDQAGFNDMKSVVDPSVKKYERLKLRAIAKVAWQTFLEYARFAQQAVGASA